MELLAKLNRQGRTVVAVLHELNQAARFATHIVAMKLGAVQAVGTPKAVVSAELVERVYGLPCVIIGDPLTGTPIVIPRPSDNAAVSAS